jgi:hypothetical protein
MLPPSAESPVDLLSQASAPVSSEPKPPPVSVMPPPALNLPPTLDVRPPPPAPAPAAGRSGAWLLLVAIMLLGLGGAAYWMYGRSGELLIVAEPAHELIVVVDQRPVAVTDSPVRLRLPPGPHAITVQHNGSTPWSETLNVGAGEAVLRNIQLSPIVHKTGGFTLLSDPPGAMVTLDGNSLGQVTPLRVQSVLAGPHTLELRLGDRIWRQPITVEAEKTIEIKATLPPSDVPTVTPGVSGQPTVTPLEPQRTPATPPTGPAEKPTVAEHPDKGQKIDKPERPEKPGAVEPPVEKPGGPKGPLAKGPRKGGKRRGPVVAATDTPTGAAAGSNGYLRINSRPWSKIIVDGIDTGLNTPQTSYRIPAGKHLITLFNPQFNIKETIVVTVQPGETQTITKIFQQH